MQPLFELLFGQPARFREAGRSLWLEGHPHRDAESQLDAGISAMIDYARPGDRRLPRAKEANCFPMIPSGAAHTDMILYGDRWRARWTMKQRRWCERR
jgi:hypothetical protein